MNNSTIAWKTRAQLDDFTDVCKPHSYKMEKLSLVRDASRSSKENVVTTRGHHGCMAVACKSGARKTVPLDLKIWSSLAEGHKGENEEVLDAMRAVDKATDGRGVRKDVLVAHIEHMHQRFNEVPEFFLYALAAGIKRAFVRYGCWETKAAVKKKDDRQPTLPGWDELSYLGVG